MCGIVGYVGRRDAVSFLLPGLRRLEYRGYDSAGLAIIDRGRLSVRKAAGRIAALESEIHAARPSGRLGIAHTRWATHGRPSDANAHPHVDCSGRIAVVHNGIIENYRELRRELVEAGHKFRSQTDTEVIAHLIEQNRTNGLASAVLRAARSLRGAYAIACIADDAPDTIVAVRGGTSPLIVGLGEGEMLLASDIPALLGRTRSMLVVGEGEMAILGAGFIRMTTLDGAEVHREPSPIPWEGEAAEKGGYPHFMLKEIHEQPEALRNTLRERLDPGQGEVRIPELGLKEFELTALNRLSFVACGTSWHAALVGKYLVESFARLPVDVDIASEFRYRQPVLDGRVLTVPISQSGETADTLAAMREARAQGSRAIAICNVVGSSVAREADGVIYTRAGIEIGVASTKAFTAQLAAVTLLALRLGLARRMLDAATARQVIRALWETPDLIEGMLRGPSSIHEVAARFQARRDFMFLGRHLHYPIALEGALKLKEISYIHAEGHAAGEMKHGPLALVDAGVPVVAVAPKGPQQEKMAANIEEVKARDGIVIAVANPRDEEIAARADILIPVPEAPHWVQPILTVIQLQLLAYHLGVARGCDVDKPRNLAKSVTVE